VIEYTLINNLNWQVEPNLFPMLASWKRESTMEDILLQLKKEMMSPQNRKLSQPPEGVSFLFLTVTTLYFYNLYLHCSSCHRHKFCVFSV